MQFRTTFQIPESSYKISHQHKILTIGSCFSDEMGSRLVNLKFNGLINPFGIIFNAYSIKNLLERSINKIYFTEEDIHQNGEIFFCFDVHSSFNTLAKDLILNQLNNTIDKVHQQILSTDVLIITLGTSWVYKWKESNKIVANCHKVQSSSFDKILLTTKENYNYLEKIAQIIFGINPNIKIITTVSPVRHIKDGIVENNISKARLIDSLFLLKQKFNTIDYFPSYEILMDDLRDYRFYKEDMIHPSDQAIDYIWDKFSETYFDILTQKNNKKIDKINSALMHKPFNEESLTHQQFLKKILSWIDEEEKENKLNFDAEKELIQKKLKKC